MCAQAVLQQLCQCRPCTLAEHALQPSDGACRRHHAQTDMGKHGRAGARARELAFALCGCSQGFAPLKRHVRDPLPVVPRRHHCGQVLWAALIRLELTMFARRPLSLYVIKESVVLKAGRVLRKGIPLRRRYLQPRMRTCACTIVTPTVLPGRAPHTMFRR